MTTTSAGRERSARKTRSSPLLPWKSHGVSGIILAITHPADLRGFFHPCYYHTHWQAHDTIFDSNGKGYSTRGWHEILLQLRADQGDLVPSCLRQVPDNLASGPRMNQDHSIELGLPFLLLAFQLPHPVELRSTPPRPCWPTPERKGGRGKPRAERPRMARVRHRGHPMQRERGPGTGTKLTQTCARFASDR